MFGFGKKEPSAKLPVKFTIPIDRKKADGSTLEFKVQVSGYFAGSGGKPTFTITGMSANGIPNMDMASFNPSELAAIEKHALNVEYKKLVQRT